MTKPTPSQVKNAIERSFKGILDPNPSRADIDRIWEYFRSECVYCGKRLDRKRKEGHIDHLIPITLNGPNHVSNRVLSCGDCNAEEKRDRFWVEFLIEKNPNQDTRELRKQRIRTWQGMNPPSSIDKSAMSEIESLSADVTRFYQTRIEIARKLKGKES